MAFANTVFNALDRNHDGVLTRAELGAVGTVTYAAPVTMTAPVLTTTQPMMTYGAPVAIAPRSLERNLCAMGQPVAEGQITVDELHRSGRLISNPAQEQALREQAARIPGACVPAGIGAHQVHHGGFVEEIAAHLPGHHGHEQHHARPGHELTVDILRAHNLYNADLFGGKSDPYCICQIVGVEDKNCQTTTRVINNQPNPQWDHQGVVHGFQETDVLEFSVWDKDAMNKDDFLGKIEVTAADFLQQGGLEGEFALQGEAHHQGSLAIRVLVGVHPGAHHAPHQGGHH